MKRLFNFIVLAKHHVENLMRKAFPKSVGSEVIGRLPYRQDTLMAHALAQLITGVRLTDSHLASFSANPKAKDVISKLRHRYDWISIQQESEFVKLADGTECQVSFYRLPDAVLKQIDTPAVRRWVCEVLELGDFAQTAVSTLNSQHLCVTTKSSRLTVGSNKQAFA